MTAFFHSVYLPTKFRVDMRINSLAAAVRSGLLHRDSALDEMSKAPIVDPILVRNFQRRLGIDPDEYEAVMGADPHYWTEFKTYKRTFETLSPLFALLVKKQLVPESFFLKYCSKTLVQK